MHHFSSLCVFDGGPGTSLQYFEFSNASEWISIIENSWPAPEQRPITPLTRHHLPLFPSSLVSQIQLWVGSLFCLNSNTSSAIFGPYFVDWRVHFWEMQCELFGCYLGSSYPPFSVQHGCMPPLNATPQSWPLMLWWVFKFVIKRFWPIWI